MWCSWSQSKKISGQKIISFPLSRNLSPCYYFRSLSLIFRLSFEFSTISSPFFILFLTKNCLCSRSLHLLFFLSRNFFSSLCDSDHFLFLKRLHFFFHCNNTVTHNLWQTYFFHSCLLALVCPAAHKTYLSSSLSLHQSHSCASDIPFFKP